VIKAAIMAGADRFTNNTNEGDITDYRDDESNRTENGLDSRYGAGQLNIHNSYQIIASGEQNSVEDDPGSQGLVGHYGFDYDPFFGGSEGSNRLASYYLTADYNHTVLCASLVWNIKINGGNLYNFDGTANVYDLDVYLYDMTSGGVEVAFSASSNENTENLFTILTSGHEYMLQIQPGQGQEDFKWDYALAWHVRYDNSNLIPCYGDFDNDGDVDHDDLLVFAIDYGRTNCDQLPACVGDFDGDNDVHYDDLTAFSTDYGRTDCP
jgi:hypothetical protein